MNPQTVGIIMDGNRRWAKGKGLPVFMGHENGYQTLRKVLDWSVEAGIKNVIAFVFSEENWNRSEGEVSFLLDFMLKVFKESIKEILEKNVKVRFAGNISRFSKEMVSEIKKIEKESEKNNGITLVLCVSYGGREEIVQCCNKLIKEGKNEITANDIENSLYTAGIPDPDLIIRTSGEIRLSGFLLWQSAYSELFFTKTLWPDFSKEEFLSILEEYKKRDRRIGK